MHITIGSRGSKLALWQAYYVQQLLETQGLSVTVKTIETKGDQILGVSLSKIGSKGVFTEELEQQLRTGEIDIAVHSAKDLPSEMGADLALIAFTEREKANDVLVSFDPEIKLTNNSGLVIGTSSTRRVALLRHFYPEVKTVDIRGNLQTRFRKLQEGGCHAMILAYAGVHRMNYDDFIVQQLPIEQFVPPAGQGSVSIQALNSLPDEKRQAIRKAVNDEKTEICLLAERSYLRILNGGCSIPSFCYAQLLPNNDMITRGGIVSLNGQTLVQDMVKSSQTQAEKAGEILATKVLRLGGDKILAEIRKG